MPGTYAVQGWAPGLKAEFLDVVYADKSPHVRAWAAAHLETVLNDYSDPKKPGRISRAELGALELVEIRNYEPGVLADTAPIVRAALWSNPNCERLPWGRLTWKISESWKEQFRGLTHLERLGIMRNPKLSKRYVVALMETPSGDLNVSRVEHAEVLMAAAMNPALIGSSRRVGRKWWGVGDCVGAPFEEYGKMWELSVSKWMDQPRVPYGFLTFIQTTPETKSAMYKVLLARGEEGLRQALIESCDPMEDQDVLKLAWTDPSKDCMKAARERVGRFTALMGVKEDAMSNE